MKRSLSLAILLSAFAATAWPAPRAPYAAREDVRAFVQELVERHQFVKEELEYVFSRARREPAILRAIEPRARQERQPWGAYRTLFVNDRHIAHGVEFWRANRAALARAEQAYGVPAEVIVAIIGVETFYGRNTGRWRTVDALSTLAFDYPPRAAFFREELIQFLVFARNAGIDVFSVRGSFAGAIGIPQFMPGSLMRYAVDFDGDGTIDLRASAADAVGSVGHFLQQHGWQPGAPVLAPVTVSGEAFLAFVDGGVEPKHTVAALAAAGAMAPELPPEARAVLLALENGREEAPEYRIGLPNFYVLTRYNRSTYYACAVMDLAASLRAALQPEGR